MKRIGALGAVCLLMSGCSQLLNVPTAYTSLPRDAEIARSPLPSDVSEGPLPPVVMPGQVRVSAFGQAGTGVDPSAVLRASASARAAWTPLKPAELALPPALAAHSADARTAAGAVDPTSTASVSTSSKGDPRRGATMQSYDRKATMDRLEKEGRKDAKPICEGC